MNHTIKELEKRFKNGYYKNIMPYNMIQFIIKKENSITVERCVISINGELDENNNFIFKSIKDESIDFLEKHPEYELPDEKLNEGIAKAIVLQTLRLNGFDLSDEEINGIINENGLYINDKNNIN